MHREVAYPHEWRRKGSIVSGPSEGEHADKLPGDRDRQRCDLVITERPGQTLRDEWRVARDRKIARSQAQGTLFESLHALAPDEPSAALKGSIAPEEALWLEIKSVAQFDISGGAAGPNPSYASGFVRGPMGDLVKLASDQQVREGAMLLIVFCADEPTLKHDFGVLVHRCLDKRLNIHTPTLRSLKILDRLGNTVCGVCVIGLRKV